MELYELECKYNEIEKKVYDKLKSTGHPNWQKRYNHSLSVGKKAYELSKLHYQDEILSEKAYLAGIIHDYCKYDTVEKYNEIIKKYNLNIKYDIRVKSIYHGILAPYIIKEELNINDEEILKAIECHVTGKENMSPLEKLIYVSDYVEDLRIGETYETSREIALQSLDRCVAYNSCSILSYLLEKKYAIFSGSLDTYNYYLKYLEPENN